MNKTVDTFSDFLSFWDRHSVEDIDSRIRGWAGEYMVKWPELLEKQINDYRSMSLDWREVAKERVFPFLQERIEGMGRARALLSVITDQVHRTAEDSFGMELNILYVLYVGIGCGAGWVTELEGSQAILLGLEMIAECGWTDEVSLRGLLAHELGHAFQGILREDPDLSGGSGPFWQLYTEGFAQRCEHLIMEHDSWNVGRGVNGPDWLEWCEDNRIWLAGKFLQAVEMGEDVKPFFGSWFDISGRKHCGHYLGHEIILELEKTADISTVARIEDFEPAVTSVLEGMITAG